MEFDEAITNLTFFSDESNVGKLSPMQKETLRKSGLIKRQ